ncbi:hypothetical protein N802_11010 [Knoellia sinensis KCTC 19936]|uniref:Uncharacterized protein n=1 Tax=Knoellia sinensis KCTC 19936 TaxID=1385520 RepID=A0A0A0J484_9MICO|nr:hypothetical protein N802_11010 [Knoellia sinensis KCTC 19936]
MESFGWQTIVEWRRSTRCEVEDLDVAVDELITFIRSGLVPDSGFLWDR